MKNGLSNISNKEADKLIDEYFGVDVISESNSFIPDYDDIPLPIPVDPDVVFTLMRRIRFFTKSLESKTVTARWYYSFRLWLFDNRTKK